MLQSYPKLRRQNGSTLIVTMMILILIMMLGVTAMVTSDTQFKLTGNLQFEDVAMNRAETAVATAESWLSTGENYKNEGFSTYDADTAHLHPIGHIAGLTAPDNNPLTMTWSDDNSLEVVDGDDTQRFFIEQVSTNVRMYGASAAYEVETDCKKVSEPSVHTYLITARGTSVRGATKFIQSYYSVMNCRK